MISNILRGLPRAMRGSALTRFLRRETAGVSAVEFALVSPVLIVILAATVDIGASLKAKFDLSSAISAGSNYALLGADKVSSTGGGTLAANIMAAHQRPLLLGQGEGEIRARRDQPAMEHAGQLDAGLAGEEGAEPAEHALPALSMAPE